jgi:hypothetical protein
MIWAIAIAGAAACTLFASVRVALVGFQRPEQNPILRMIAADAWCWFLLLLIPMTVGSFARGEVSSLPWVAFSESFTRHGLIDGVTQAAIMTTVDLWLLWIPAHIFTNHPDADARTRGLARFLNLAVGLLLMAKANPLYQLLDLVPPADPNDY